MAITFIVFRARLVNPCRVTNQCEFTEQFLRQAEKTTRVERIISARNSTAFCTFFVILVLDPTFEGLAHWEKVAKFS